MITAVFPLGRVPLARRPFWSEDVVLAMDEVNAYTRSLEGAGITVRDAFSILADEQGKMQSAYSQDMLHLNAVGYEALNKELIKAISKAGLEPSSHFVKQLRDPRTAN